MKKKRSICLLVSWIVGVLYAIYIVYYFATASAGAEDAAAALGAGIATALVMPHMLCVVIAVIFNVLGWSTNKRGFALTGAILYTASIVLFPLYFMFVILEAVLSFVGFARLKKINSNNTPAGELKEDLKI